MSAEHNYFTRHKIIGTFGGKLSTILLYDNLFAIDDIYAFTWSVYFSTLQIVLCALTMPSLRNPSGYNLRLYYA